MFLRFALVLLCFAFVVHAEEPCMRFTCTSTCTTLPSNWIGSWFQSGVDEPITITEDTISTKGRCVEVLRSIFNDLLFIILEDNATDDATCYRCLTFKPDQEHLNVLNFMESTTCSPVKPEWPLIGFCQTFISEDRSQFLFRLNSEPVPCTIRSPMNFSWFPVEERRNCDDPVSTLEPRQDGQGLRFTFKGCPDIEEVEEIECLATWQAPYRRALAAVGRFVHDQDLSNEDSYRCYLINNNFDPPHLEQSKNGNCNSISKSHIRNLQNKHRVMVLQERLDDLAFQGISEGPCTFEDDWIGTWFQPGVEEPITITHSTIPSKGRCRNKMQVDGWSSKSFYIFEDLENSCFRCVAIYDIQVYINFLSYGESPCLPAENTKRLCSNLTGLGELLPRLNAPPITCPIASPFNFTYYLGKPGETEVCAHPISRVEPIQDGKRLRFNIANCSGGPEIIEEVECVAILGYKNDALFVGKFIHDPNLSNEDSHRCYDFRKNGNDPPILVQVNHSRCKNWPENIGRTMILQGLE